MAKSVFISSTSMDLREHRAAVNSAIRRLELRPIDMQDFGSQPGGAKGVSVREVSKADIFVGILARRYGYVPEGQVKSVTEQEYDEAVRLRLPRLMYLVDPNYAWLPELVEADETAQAKLAAFKARVEKNEVRSLFTIPENLAQQVTADLVNLSDKQQRQQLIYRVLAAAVSVIALIALALIADAGIRSRVIEIAGLASPTPTVTATPTTTGTPTPTSTPTNTPTPTATPLEGTAFASDKVGVIVADFTYNDPNNPNTVHIEPNLESEFTDAGVPFIRVHHTLASREDAQAVSALYNATIVMWGEVSAGGVRLQFEITPRRSEVETTIENLQVAATDLQSFNVYIFQGMDTLYLVDFVQGQEEYFNYNYDAALTAFNDAIGRIPSGRESSVKASTLYFYRGNVYYRQKNYGSALDDYNWAITLDPNDALAFNNRGNVYYLQSDYEHALDDYNQAITLDPNYATAFNNRGNVYDDTGYSQQAIDDYSQALTLKPANAANTYYDRGVAYYHLNEYQQAIDDYSQAITLDPANAANAYSNRGAAYDGKGNTRQAIDDYSQALALNPNDSISYYLRGSDYLDQGNASLAFQDFNSAIELDANFPQAYAKRGLLNYVTGNYPAAIADYRNYERLTGHLEPIMQQQIDEMQAATAEVTATPQS